MSKKKTALQKHTVVVKTQQREHQTAILELGNAIRWFSQNMPDLVVLFKSNSRKTSKTRNLSLRMHESMCLTSRRSWFA